MGKPSEDALRKYLKIPCAKAIIWKELEVEAEEQDGAIEIRLTKFLCFKNLTLKGARAKTSAAP
ncbi:MAG: hypothetical protein HY885_01735 [Deltaproteobacteria bacterium]|nr:hypothetical protein [Deltaproteobacteria bacterium]